MKWASRKSVRKAFDRRRQDAPRERLDRGEKDVVSKDEIRESDDRQSARNDPLKCLDHEGNVFDAREGRDRKNRYNG
jgi:hypothetical protein